VRIDTGKPIGNGKSKNVTVKHGEKASLTLRSTTDTQLRNRQGDDYHHLKKKIVKTIKLRVPANKVRSCSFKVKLKKGNYTWTVKATDIAGNVGKVSAAKKLIVK